MIRIMAKKQGTIVRTKSRVRCQSREQTVVELAAALATLLGQIMEHFPGAEDEIIALSKKIHSERIKLGKEAEEERELWTD